MIFVLNVSVEAVEQHVDAQYQRIDFHFLVHCIARKRLLANIL